MQLGVAPDRRIRADRTRPSLAQPPPNAQPPKLLGGCAYAITTGANQRGIMHSGYLTIETNPAYPGTIRLRGTNALPADRPTSLKYASRFTDLDAALMHFHSALRRHLVDLEPRIYRTSEPTAIAVAEAIELPHRRVFIDPDLANDPDLNTEIARLHRSHRRWDHLFDVIGILALLLLLATAFL